MELPVEVAAELAHSVDAADEGNLGKARVCARRAVGKAFMISSYSTGFPSPLSAAQCLKALTEMKDLPEEVRAAARRLATGVAEKGDVSISVKPVEDATAIITQLLAG